jgi:glycosyltransferase involved in cell wall biosynthesis
MARLAESLAHGGADVRLLSLNPRKHRLEGNHPLPTETVDIDTSRRIGPLLRASTSRMPFIVARYVSSTFETRLIASLRSMQPDVVQIESPFLLPYVPVIRAHSEAVIAMRSLNVEFRIWEELAATESNPLKRMALRRVAASLRAYELRAMQSCDAILPISDDDASDFRALGSTVPMFVVPCGVPLPVRKPIAEERDAVGFIGSLDYRPNQQAALWIVEELWPRVVARMPEAKLSIAGNAPPPWLRERLHATTVPDAQEFMQRQTLMIAPILSGGGMRIKTLEAMALGKAVVATTRGVGGLTVRNGMDIVVADGADAFADALVSLLRDDERRNAIAASARATVARLYDPDRIGSALLSVYESLVGTSVSTARANQNQRRP